jgi:hypothetical protein
MTRCICPASRGAFFLLSEFGYRSSVLEHSSGVWRCGSHACLTCSVVRPRKRSWSAQDVTTKATMTSAARPAPARGFIARNLSPMACAWTASPKKRPRLAFGCGRGLEDVCAGASPPGDHLDACRLDGRLSGSVDARLTSQNISAVSPSNRIEPPTRRLWNMWATSDPHRLEFNPVWLIFTRRESSVHF